MTPYYYEMPRFRANHFCAKCTLSIMAHFGMLITDVLVIKVLRACACVKTATFFVGMWYFIEVVIFLSSEVIPCIRVLRILTACMVSRWHPDNPELRQSSPQFDIRRLAWRLVATALRFRGTASALELFLWFTDRMAVDFPESFMLINYVCAVFHPLRVFLRFMYMK